MAEITIADFEFLANNGNITYDAETTAPLDGSRSGSIDYVDGSTKNSQLLATTTGGAAGSLGQTRAQMTVHVNWQVLASNTAHKRFGMSSMHSTHSIQSSGAAYYAFLDAQSSGDRLVFAKFSTGGLTSITATEIASVSYGSLSQDSPFWFRFVWAYDSDFAATLLQIWTGSTLGSLALGLEYIDMSSPLSTSVAEALTCAPNTSSGAGTWLIDSWDLTPV